MGPNYDDSLQEPLVLPAKIPNLLVNGSSGIAVGMATNIPPHNLSEVVDGIIAVIENPALTLEELMERIPGPDFPTAGFIYGTEGILSAYRTGRGIIQMRARARVEKQKKTERESIIVTEIPYQVNKARLIEKIAELVREKKIEGISDLRDESDRDGMRIVIELKKDENPQVLLNQLYKQTQMQSLLRHHHACHRQQPAEGPHPQGGDPPFHRSPPRDRHPPHRFRAEESGGPRPHPARPEDRPRLAGRGHRPDPGVENAGRGQGRADGGALRRPLPTLAANPLLCLSELQAQAILEMRLHRLTGLERDKIIQEYEDILRFIARLKEILGSEAEILKIIKGELLEVKEKFGDPRRTEIIGQTAEITLEDTIVEEDMVVTISHTGYIKRSAVSLYRAQRRGGKGKTGMKTKEEDFVEQLFIASTKDYMLFFTDAGKVYWLKVYEIPEGGRATRGKAIVNLLNLSPNENISAILPVKEFTDDRFIMMATRLGVVKKTPLLEYSHPRAGGIIAVNLDEGDKLIAVALTDGKQDVLLASKNGKSIRFREEDARPMGRVTRGVRGMTLEDDDVVIGMVIVNEQFTDSTLFTVTENGFGKRTELTEYRRQSRGGKGVITIKTTERNGCVVDIKQVTDENDLMLITDQGKIIRMPIAGFSVIGRNTQGVRLMVTEENERIVAVARLAEKEENEENEENAEDEETDTLTDPDMEE